MKEKNKERSRKNNKKGFDYILTIKMKEKRTERIKNPIVFSEETREKREDDKERIRIIVIRRHFDKEKTKINKKYGSKMRSRRRKKENGVKQRKRKATECEKISKSKCDKIKIDYRKRKREMQYGRNQSQMI